MLIKPVKAGGRSGVIGLCDCPGRDGSATAPAVRRQNLERDIQVVKEWRAQGLVSALEDEELKSYGVENVGVCATRAGMWWFRIPVKRDATPDNRFWNAWPHAAPALLDILRRGQRVAVHSADSGGRASLVICCLLVELGLQPDAALNALRGAVDGAAISPSQELFLREYLPKYPEHTRLQSPQKG